MSLRFIYRKIGRLLISINKLLWTISPTILRQSRFGLLWGRSIFKLVEIRGGRNQLTTTYFFRNRPELELLQKIIRDYKFDEKLTITVIGCSEGAEVISLLYYASKIIPIENISISAYDISESALAIAKSGKYAKQSRVLSLLKKNEFDDLFNFIDNNFYQIKEKYSNTISWYLADPTEDPVKSSISKQDIVFANRFLFHMPKEQQRKTLSNISTIVKNQGYLFVSGVDLDIRTTLAETLNWIPLPESIQDIHNSDKSMTMDWPFKYWGLEPFDEQHPNKMIRYCCVYKMP